MFHEKLLVKSEKPKILFKQKIQRKKTCPIGCSCRPTQRLWGCCFPSMTHELVLPSVRFDEVVHVGLSEWYHLGIIRGPSGDHLETFVFLFINNYALASVNLLLLLCSTLKRVLWRGRGTGGWLPPSPNNARSQSTAQILDLFWPSKDHPGTIWGLFFRFGF